MTKDYGYPSFDLICKASSGDETSIKEILNFYDVYITMKMYPCSGGTDTVSPGL